MKWIAAILRWLAGLLDKRQALAAADTAATQRNQDAAHAVEHVEAGPPASEPVVSDRLRDGSF